MALSPTSQKDGRPESLARLRREVERLRRELEAMRDQASLFVRLELDGHLTAEQRARLRDHRLRAEALGHELRRLWAEFGDLQGQPD